MAQKKKNASRGSKPKRVSRSGSSKGRSSGKGQTAKKPSVKKQIDKKRFGDSIYDEIVVLALIIISVIVLLSLCTSVMGIFGDAVNNVFKGLIGIGSFILPVLVSVFGVWFLVSEKREGAVSKAVAIVIFVLAVSAVSQIISDKTSLAEGISLSRRIGSLYKDGNGANGGVLGGMLAYFLYRFVGWGSYIILFAAIIISFMLGTGKSAFNAIGLAYNKITEAVKSRREAYGNDYDDIYDEEDEPKRPKKKKSHKSDEEEYERRMREMDKYNSVPRHKKGNFNIIINGEEGAAKKRGVPVVDVKVFKKKEPEIEEEKKEDIYDFRLDVPEEDDFKLGENEKFIEVIGSFAAEVDDKAEDEPLIFGVFNDEESSLNSAPDIDIDEPELNESLGSEEIAAEESVSESSEGVDIENVIEEDEEDKAVDVGEAADTIEFEAGFDEPEIDEGHGAENEPVLENPLSAEADEQKTDEETAKATDEPSSENEAEEIAPEVEPVKKEYVFPPIELLGKEPSYSGGETKSDMMLNAKKLEETLSSFGVQAKVIQINKGPTVTRYELTPSQGVKVSKIVNLADDIALNLAATGIRIEAPIPGKAAVGIEVPNKEAQSVYMRTVIESDEFKNAKSKVTFALGEDIAGNVVVTDIAKMPHMLIAGATGSGKSVCINTIITSILYKAKPDEVKLLLVDPKVVELSVYNGIPHLLIPVVTDPKKAAGALNWAVREMLKRYNTFAECKVRDLKGYNAMKAEKGETDFMPQIVIIIDELADLMMAAPNEVEDSICRLAQLARAAGMHLVIATQRPSVDVITGVIKANIPSRIAFAVSSGIDSRTILDTVGAEKLIGKGDMLFYPTGMNKPLRVQGAFVTDKEVESIVDFIKDGGETVYDNEVIENITSSAGNGGDGEEEKDEFFDKAVDLVVSKEKASVSMLQRQFRIGYNRAARIVEDMERKGIVGPEEGSKPRRVLISRQQLEEMRAPKAE